MDAEPDADPGDDQVQVSSLDTCLEDDFGATPWLGPGVSPDGTVTAEIEGELLLSVTALQLREGDAQAAQAFNDLLGPITDALLVSEGLIGTSLGRSTACSSARTVSLWRDRASMMQFFANESHIKAVGEIGTVAQFYKSTTVAVDAGDVAVLDWSMNAARLADIPTIELR